MLRGLGNGNSGCRYCLRRFCVVGVSLGKRCSLRMRFPISNGGAENGGGASIRWDCLAAPG